MLFRLLLFVIGTVGFFAIPGAGVAYLAYRLARPALARYRARRLGAAKAKLLSAHEPEHCVFCLEPVLDPKEGQDTCYSKEYGWYHYKCLKALKG